jgi:hypothetical protein
MRITRQAIRRGTFTSVKHLISAIEIFIAACDPTGLRPLRRKPKELSAEPALLDVPNGGGGMVVPGGEPRDRSVPGSSRRGTERP